MISAEQGAFIRGRSIYENISLAQEIINLLNKKTKGGNVLLKVDMAKAYNRVDLKFLRLVLRSLDFSDQVCSFKSECMETP